MSAAADRLVSSADLLRFSTELLQAGGFAPEQARQTADLLVWANLRGIDSHGVLRIPRYIEMVELKLINPAATPRRVAGRGAICVIDADRAPGSQAMNIAADTAFDLSSAHGIGWCAVRSITHAGAVGYFAEKIAKRGRVALVMTASKPLMVYFGAKGESVSTNPLAIAAPMADPECPLLLDMSTAAVALGKIMAAKDAGRSIPPGWAVDKDGRETTDPAAAKAVLPMAGAKGSGLSLMIEVLASVLAGNPLISVALTAGGDPGGNGLVVAVDPSAFGSDVPLARGVQDLADAIHALSPAAGHTRVLLPGERGASELKRRVRDGVPVATGTMKRLLTLAQQLGVSTAGMG